MPPGAEARRLPADQRSQGGGGEGVCDRCSATTRCSVFFVLLPVSLRKMPMMMMTHRASQQYEAMLLGVVEALVERACSVREVPESGTTRVQGIRALLQAFDRIDVFAALFMLRLDTLDT